MSDIKAPKKLIEVALPLDDINAAAAREKSIRHGHPSTLHLWWARRPLAAARAVLFAQMVNDPGGERGYKAGKTREQADAEREQLFQILRELVLWENTNNETVLEKARAAIKASWCETCELNKGKPGFDPEKLPAFHDPFAGGGAIPLEAQRLGLESYASDLNPVAVMINKAMIEIPPKFAGQAPVGPLPASEKQTKIEINWPGATGLAEDVRRYGHWMREEAFKRIGHLYPQIEVTPEMAESRPDLKPLVGQKLTVIAWLWARTVKSPNPAFSHVDVPLVSSFVLSSKKGKEAWVEPVIEGDGYRFEVRVGDFPEIAKNGTKMARANFECLLSNSPISGDYIKIEGQSNRLSARLMAIVAEGSRGRVYLSPTLEQVKVAEKAQPDWQPEGEIAKRMTGGNCTPYGLTSWGKLFTSRQLVALNTFSDLVQEARKQVIADAQKAGWSEDGQGLAEGGVGAIAYGDAVAVYLGFGSSRAADAWSSVVTWRNQVEASRNTFARQAIPMTWDFTEINPFSASCGNWIGNSIDWVNKSLLHLPQGLQSYLGNALQSDAQTQAISQNKLISTDPPYYDNIGYADLSDFFYVWLRRSLKNIYPALFSTLAVPKAEELVATPYRHGNKQNAEQFFLNGMTQAIHNLAQQAHPAFPVSIYYAFKQSETSDKGSTSSTGWETFLEAILQAGFAITGTWPMRTEKEGRVIGNGTNALASSIVLVCRKRDSGIASQTGMTKNSEQAGMTISRREFQRELREQMPIALETMIGGKQGSSPVAPVDLAQAAIGPGMAIFSQYASVLNQDGSAMSVHDALILINREITDYLSPEAAGFDGDTLFCSAWFEQYGWGVGPFGEADTLSRAKGTSVEGVKQAGVIDSGGGKVKLIKWSDYAADWSPENDNRVPVWEACHQLIRALKQVGESGAGALLAQMPDKGEPIRQLAYHLYTLCERKKWAEDARVYNELVTSWHEIMAVSHEIGHSGTQLDLGLE